MRKYLDQQIIAMHNYKANSDRDTLLRSSTTWF